MAASSKSLRTCAGSSQLPTPPHQTIYSDQRSSSFSTTSPAYSTAQLVKVLREATGAPMMECKKALSSPEVNNDIEKAREWLRKHGSAKASSKVAGREALEGLVGIRIETGEGEGGKRAVASLVKVASETDFASRSPAFSSFVQEVADSAASSTPAEVSDVASFLSSATNGDGRPLNEGLKDAILAIRENLRVDSISLLEASDPDSVLAGYVHGRASPDVTCGTAASIVEVGMTTSDDREGWYVAHDAAKKLAMHVVAAKPLYLNPASVPEDVVEKEKQILTEKMEGSNKPPEILEKIVTGQLRKFYEGICLSEQSHMVEEGNPKVEKALKGLGLELRGFKLMGMSKS